MLGECNDSCTLIWANSWTACLGHIDRRICVTPCAFVCRPTEAPATDYIATELGAEECSLCTIACPQCRGCYTCGCRMHVYSIATDERQRRYRRRRPRATTTNYCMIAVASSVQVYILLFTVSVSCSCYGVHCPCNRFSCPNRQCDCQAGYVCIHIDALPCVCCTNRHARGCVRVALSMYDIWRILNTIRYMCTGLRCCRIRLDKLRCRTRWSPSGSGI